MHIAGRDIEDACTECSEILECELFRQGHGINCERTNIAKMVACQMSKGVEKTEGE